MRAIMAGGLCGIWPGESAKIRGRFFQAGAEVMVRGGRRFGHAASLALLAACALTAARAQAPAAPAAAAVPGPLQGDAKHGKDISYTCLGCHGIDSYRNA